MEDGTIVTPDREQAWLAERQRSVGASESATVLGIGRDTPVQLWQRKLGLIPPVEENDAMRWGKALEPLVLAEYERVTGRTVGWRQKFLRHVRYPWMTATLDGRTDDAEGRLVEAKTSGIHMAEHWGEEGTDEIPEWHLIQVQHQMAVTGAAVADVAVLIGGQRWALYTVERSEPLIEVIERRVAQFWGCVNDRKPPDWGRMTSADLAAINPRCGGSIVLPADIQRLVQEYEEDGEILKSFEARREEKKLAILAALGDAEFGQMGDGRAVKRYRKEVAEATRSYVVQAHVQHYFKVVKGRV